MSNTFTLANMVAETRRRFEPVTIELDEDTSFELPSVLRLGKKDRESVIDALDSVKEVRDSDSEDDLDETETELVVEAMGLALTRINPKAKKLLKAIEDEEPLVQLTILSDILGSWMERTQPGEA
jgi:hypothetical protein